MDGQQPTQSTDDPVHFAPGDTISPQQAPPAPTLPAPATTPETTAAPTTPAEPATSAPAETSPAPAPSVASQPASSPVPPASESAPSDDDIQSPPTTYWQGDPAESISWTASEFIAHHKSGGWYVLALLGALIAAALVWLLTKDIVSPIVIVLMGAILAIFAGRQPRQLTYQLDPSGLSIGPRHYVYGGFRSFSVVPDGAFTSIVFAPLKRFGVMTTVYYDPQDEDRIVDILSRHLPHEPRQPDPIDQLMRRLHF